MIFNLQTPENRVNFAKLLLNHGFRDITHYVYKREGRFVISDYASELTKHYFKKGRLQIIFDWATINIYGNDYRLGQHHECSISLKKLSEITGTIYKPKFYYVPGYIYSKKINKLMPNCFDKAIIEGFIYGDCIRFHDANDIDRKGTCGINEFPKCYEI